jgi:hypothetical protein
MQKKLWILIFVSVLMLPFPIKSAVRSPHPICSELLRLNFEKPHNLRHRKPNDCSGNGLGPSNKRLRGGKMDRIVLKGL